MIPLLVTAHLCGKKRSDASTTYEIQIRGGMTNGPDVGVHLCQLIARPEKRLYGTYITNQPTLLSRL